MLSHLYLEKIYIIFNDAINRKIIIMKAKLAIDYNNRLQQNVIHKNITQNRNP